MYSKLTITLKMECECPYCNSKIDLVKNDFYADNHNLLIGQSGYKRKVEKRKIKHEVLCPNCEEIFFLDSIIQNF